MKNAGKLLTILAVLALAALPALAEQTEEATMDTEKKQVFVKPDDTTLKQKLTKEQYEVTQHAGTERPFTGEYWNTFEKGIYVDIVTGEPLFTSMDKYLSSCGWPSFSAPIDKENIRYLQDLTHGMTRTEVRSKGGNSHLGHVFENDPESPNGVRYCINSASLKFIPYEEMEEKGYGEWLYLFDQHKEETGGR